MENSIDPLTGNGDILVVSSVVKPFCLVCHEAAPAGEKPHEKIGFLTPTGHKIDYKYQPHETPVMMTKDGHGLSYLGHLFGRLNKSLERLDFKDPKEYENSEPFDSYKTVISIGSHLSNSVTARIMDRELPRMYPDQIRFLFTELGAKTDWDTIECIEQENSQPSMLPSEKQEFYDYGAIVYFRNQHTHFFVLSGLGPLGVREACNWFGKKYEDNRKRFEDNPYFQIIKVRRNQESIERPSEVAFNKLKTIAKGVAKPKRFAVALSFPGEHRSYVEKIADVLAATLTKQRVFYDRYHEAELSRPNLDTYLQRIYHDDSELVAVVLCKEYDEKEWCGLEFRAIRDLIKKRRDNEIMFVRVADGDVKGVFGIDGYVDAQNRQPADIAKLILARLELNP